MKEAVKDTKRIKEKDIIVFCLSSPTGQALVEIQQEENSTTTLTILGSPAI
jgi:hypothetical protein